MGILILLVWFAVGVGVAVYVTLIDEDLHMKDIPLLFICGCFGFLMIGLLIEENVIKLPKLFSSNAVLFKKFKKK